MSDVTQALKTYYDKLFQDGYLVNVHISKWSMCTQLNKEDLNLRTNIPRLFKLGKKMLIDPKHLNKFVSIESRARKCLYDNSYKFHIAEAHFVPQKKLLSVLDKLDQCKIDYDNATEEFIENYQSCKDEVLSLDEFADIKEYLPVLYPPELQLRLKFRFHIESFEISMPREFSPVNIQELIGRERAEAEVKKEISDRLQHQYQNSLTQIEEFVDDAARALRSQIFNTCNILADKIKKREIITHSNITMIHDEILNFKSLNFFNDKAVADEINKLEAFIDRGHDYKTDKEALTILTDTLSKVLEKTNNVTDIPLIRGEYLRAIKL